ncbi:MAG: pyruvate, phosphate dikinase [Rhodobiaceae bacterium]|nr:pyruvate, phosphate dikinase [Rhodobiaceae bacterium]
MNKWIYSFDSDIKHLDNPAKLIGNKGNSLSLMTSLGLPVPEGFTITTELNHHYEKNNTFPEGFKEELSENIKVVEKSSKSNFGSSKNPLLFSVRSGSERSMPGMLDTVLNIGFNRDVLEFFEKKDLSLFAWDTWRRFLHMFSHVVYRIEHFYFDEILDSYLLGAGLQFEKDLGVNDIKEICDQYLNLIEEKTGSPFPESADDQLWLAIKAVMKSWFNERAIDFRKINNIPESIGTAINIQRMVFGNLDEDSSTGVVFSRNPENGKRKLKGEYIIRSQGEDIVSGFKTPWVISTSDKKNSPSTLYSLEELLPGVYNDIKKFTGKLENYFSCIQDVEFTVESGKLWILQSRKATVNINAAVKIAIDMEKEGLISREDAILSLQVDKIKKLLTPVIDPNFDNEIITKGLPASSGVVTGKVVFDSKKLKNYSNKKHNTILVLKETSPNDVNAMNQSTGVLTCQGGMTSHAAVVARGLNKTCVTGARDIKIDLDNKRFHCGELFIFEGDIITINGGNGEVLVGDAPTKIPSLPETLLQIIKWSKVINKSEDEDIVAFLKETQKIIKNK